MKGMHVYVYRNSHIGDSTNRGISSKFTTFILIGEDVPEIFEPSEDCPALYLKKSMVFGPERWFYIIEPERKHARHYMFGGNFAYTSDSRFPTGNPIKIHDRLEGYRYDR